MVTDPITEPQSNQGQKLKLTLNTNRSDLHNNKILGKIIMEAV